MAFKKSSVFIKAVSAFSALLIAVLSFASCSNSKGAVSEKIGEIKENPVTFSNAEYHKTNEENLVFVTSSGLAELYFDSENYSICVKDTNNEKYWYSLPVTAQTNSTSAVVSIKVSKDNNIYYLNSQDNSVAFGSASFRPTSGGIQVTYNMALEKDIALAGFVANNGELFVSVTVIYSLSDGTLNAKVNCGDIMMSDGYTLETIELLDYFGASEKSQENDYIFVPDQSGALIMLGSKVKDEYESRNYRVYGKDISMGSLNNHNEDGTVEFASAVVPAFGMKCGDNAFSGIVIAGDTIATINSHRYSGKGTYNRVGVVFRITDVTYSGGTASKTKYVGERYTGEIETVYRFLSGKSASYVGLAGACREILIREGVLPGTRTSIDEHIPLAVNIQAAVAKGSGHSYKILSTYEQALDMLVVMKAKSVNSVNLRYSGVLDGANAQDVISKASAISSLGSKEEFAALKQYTDTQKFDMYLDINVFSTGSKSSADIAKNMAGEAISYSKANLFSSVAGKDTSSLYAVSLSDVSNNTVRYLNNSNNLQFSGICIADAGNVLYSDYSDEAHNRNNAVNILNPAISMISNNHKLMVSGGNFCVLQNANYVCEIAEHTDYPETTAYVQVPFVEIILHGVVDYSLEAVNVSADPQKAFMKAVEYGAIPSYKWYCSKTGNTEADDVFYYENQIEDAVKKYKLADKVLGDLRNARITAHSEVADGVFCTEYNNNVVVYFNYNDKAVNVNSVKVPANSFLRVS